MSEISHLKVISFKCISQPVVSEKANTETLASFHVEEPQKKKRLIVVKLWWCLHHWNPFFTLYMYTINIQMAFIPSCSSFYPHPISHL